MAKSGLCIDKELHKKECKSYYNNLFAAKAKYLKKEIAESDVKQLFNNVKKLSTPNRATILPDHHSDVDIFNKLGEFFQNKIDPIVSSFAYSPSV